MLSLVGIVESLNANRVDYLAYEALQFQCHIFTPLHRHLYFAMNHIAFLEIS